MSEAVHCPHCGRSARLPPGAAGRKVRCPHADCRKVFAVPADATPSARPREGAPSNGTAAAALEACPACRAPLLPGAIACMDCGFLLHGSDDAVGHEIPSLCPNPACGIANPPRERYCQRCGAPLPTPPGTILHGRYRIERQLAVGGFGAVYLALDVKAGNRPVAIKDMICSDAQEFDIRLNFFRREAEILRNLDDVPIVPRVYDFIQQGQSAHLVLEYIHGRNLLQVLETRGYQPFSLDLVVEWGRSICDVLRHMHGLSPPVVHRDLKPENIMLLEDQQRIKLIDFGTARDVGRTRQSQLATKTRVFTEGYAPPEQIVGKPEPRSDLFALAGTLYHLATGEAPSGIATARALAAKLVAVDNSFSAAERWFFELVRINLSEDVSGRYFSAREFQNDLARRQVTRETACPACGAKNRVREPYCCKCAEPLTDLAPPCGRCGKPNRMGSRWCIHCGHSMR